MVEIQLTQGQVAIVDDCDADLVMLKWHSRYDSKMGGYYAQRKSNLRIILMHRVILSRMLGRELLSTEHVDHIHHNTLDNRRSEIRLATIGQNSMNRSMRSDNASGYKGVHWNSQAKKWKVQIEIDGDNIYLGRFDDPILAALAYDTKARELFGEFAVLNFP